MIKFFFYIFFFSFSTLGFGLFLNQQILKKNHFSSIGETGLLGLFFIAFYSTVIHFFLPLSPNLNLYFHVIGIVIFFLNYQKFFINLKKLDYFIFSLSIVFAAILFYSHEPNEDFGFYHLPYIVNFTSEKIIFGLNSLQIQQGWNSIWLNIHSAFVIDTLDYSLTYLLNSIFFIFIISIFSSEIIKNFDSKIIDCKIAFYFSFLFLIFFLIKFSRLNSYGLDVPGNYLLVISILYFFKAFQADKININYFMLITIFLLFSVTIRISNLPFLIIIIYLFFKNKIYKQVLFSKFLLFVTIFFIAWTTQQFIYTSCLIIPNELTCLKTLWYDENYLKAFSESTLTVNKSYESYTGDLTMTQYYENFQWVPTWFFRNLNELLEYVATFCLPLIILSIFNKPKITRIDKYHIPRNDLFFLIIIIIIALLLWFYNSPVIRMGNHFIMLLIFLTIVNFEWFKKMISNKISKKIVFSLIIFSLIFSGSKNLNRINNINNNSENAPWPYFHTVSYKTISQNNFSLNTIIETGVPQTSVCWDTPIICRTKNFDDLEITRIFNNYLLIKKKQ